MLLSCLQADNLYGSILFMGCSRFWNSELLCIKQEINLQEILWSHTNAEYFKVEGLWLFLSDIRDDLCPPPPASVARIQLANPLYWVSACLLLQTLSFSLCQGSWPASTVLRRYPCLLASWLGLVRAGGADRTFERGRRRESCFLPAGSRWLLPSFEGHVSSVSPRHMLSSWDSDTPMPYRCPFRLWVVIPPPQFLPTCY